MEDHRKQLEYWRRRLSALEGIRKRGWEAHWRELSHHFMPRRSRFLDAGERTNEGEERNRLFDGVGIMARRTLSAGMQSGLTSPARPWFMLTLQDEELAKTPEVKWWLHQVYNLMVAIFGRSNFYDQIHLLYDELGTFGTGCMMVEEDPEATLRCRTLTVGEYALDTNASGRVDVVYRRIRMTARQIVEQWPETAPAHVRNRASRGSDEWLEVVHVVEPNPDFGPGEDPRRVRPIRSAYFLQGSNEILEMGGYYEFPALCPRWNTTGSDIYGESPAMDALNDCRALQKVAYDGVAALEKEVNPPLIVATGTGDSPIDVSPGAPNYISPLTQGQIGITPLYQVKANLQALTLEKQDLRNSIKEHFYNDLFLMVSGVNRQMTATEVDTRNQEKLLLLGPVLDRLRSELFQPLIVRLYGLMDRRGMIPRPPEALQGQEIKVEFISILAMAQKQQGMGAINNVVSFIGQTGQMIPEALDKLNIDEAIDEVADMNGIPPKVVRSAEEAAQIRAQRQEREAQQQQIANTQGGMAAASQGAKALKDFAAAQAAGAAAQTEEQK